MEMNDFDTGFLASSRQVALWLFGWPCQVGRVGGLLFRTHSEQRARGSRGQISFYRKANIILSEDKYHMKPNLVGSNMIFLNRKALIISYQV